MARPKARPKGKTAKLSLARLELVGDKAVKPHPKNPRKHPLPDSPEWDALKRSLLNVYFDPLVVNKRNNMLVSGHLRRKVLMAEGYSLADMTVVDVTEKQHVAMMIAANRMQGEDDVDALAGLLEGMDADELALTGLDDDELTELLSAPAYLGDLLPDTGIAGEDTQAGRFILVWVDDEERDFWIDKLGVDGKKVVYEVGDVR